nr:Ig-like domain repeat protein [uncultured Methanobrevibacter sp.]
MLFLVIGAVNAADSINVLNTEDSNLMDDNEDSLSLNNKLEISNEVSISETNIVNSHDDNLGDYPGDEVLEKSADSYYEDNKQNGSTSNDVGASGENTLGSTSSSADSVVSDSSSDNIVSADSSSQSSVIASNPVSTSLSIADTHYSKSATIFDVTLKDKNGNILSNQKISLTVNKKSYSGFTNGKGIASIKTESLKVGTYTISLSYGGNSDYSSSSLSKKVKVSSSVVGSDLNKYYGTASKYSATFWKDGSLLTNAKVTFRVGGKTYTKTTDNNGVASINIYLAAGNYDITAINPYSKEQVSHKIVVKKDSTKFDANDKTFVHANKKSSFSVVLKSKHNVLLKNKKITFTYNGKTVTSKTNANGKASITIPVLAKGTYKITYRYNGNKNLYSKTGSATIIVADAKTKLTSSIVVMYYNDGSDFKVKLTKSNGQAVPNKFIKFTLGGKTTLSKTNGKGTATLSLKDIDPGNYVVKYSYSKKGTKYYSYGSNKIIILKLVAKITASDMTMKANDGSSYKVTVKDNSGHVLKDVIVKSTINGKSYTYKTDSKGVAKLKITQDAGYYSVKSILADPFYKSAPVSKHILVKGNKFIAENMHVSIGSKATYSVKLVDERNNPVKNKEVKFTFNGKVSKSKTDSKGMAKVSLGVLSQGSHTIQFSQDSIKGSSKIYVSNTVTIKNILAASKTVKSYISKNHKLPSTVKIGDASFKTADYLYLVSKAIVNLKAGNKKVITIKIIDNPSKPKSATDMGYLRDYLGVAKSIVKTAESKGKMPNSVSSKIGTIGYNGVVSALSNVLVSYQNNDKMPAYVSVKSLSSSSSSITGVLNFKNTISNLAAYLAASNNCEVNNAKIKKLVLKLTKDCKSEKEKAAKIFNYVRDTISYSFYYNTRHGAVGTLNAGSGNCVDHAHLLVAMYRSAGLAARYVHGTCHFSSGNTYGHVWAQVLVGNTWTVADATSSRNSLGSVANWNTHSYRLQAYYSSLPF